MDNKGKEVRKTGGLEVAGFLNLAADFTHNFTDGLAIAGAFSAGYKVGVTTTLAVFLHEIPHEIGDFAILVKSGFTKKQAVLAQFSTAIGAMLGTVVGLLADHFSSHTGFIIPLTAGGFIYVATVTVIPELLTDCSFAQTVRESVAILIGILLMVVIAYLE